MAKKSSRGAHPPKARTAGQSSSPADQKSLHGESAKNADLARDTVDPGKFMTGNQGVRISDDQNSLQGRRARPDAAGGLSPPGEDHPLRSRAHPRARRACARCRGARRLPGLRSRSPTSPRPAFLHDPARQTPVFVRFSTVAGSRGSTDTRARRAWLRRQVLHRGRRSSTWSATICRSSSSRTRSSFPT